MGNDGIRRGGRKPCKQCLRYAKYNARAELVAEFTRTRLANEETIKRLVDSGIGGFIRDALGRINRFIRSMRLNGKELTQADYLTQAENALRKAINERRRMGNGQESGETQYLLDPYSQRQIDNWLNTNKIIVYDGNTQTIDDFISDSLQHPDPDHFRKLYFGRINHDLAVRIKNETGYDTEGINLTLASTEIQKVLVNSHGDSIAEANRGQVKITGAEVIDAVTTIESPDEIINGQYTGNHGPVQNAITFRKNINGRETVVTYIATGPHDLRILTIYKGAQKKSLATTTDVQAPVFTSETLRGTALDNNVKQNGSLVNPQNEKDSEYLETNPDIRYSLDGEITDADILQMLVDEGVLQTMEPGIEPALSAIGALADKTPGTNTDPNDVRSGQRIISDMMGAMGLTADARHARYDLHLRKGTAGYTMQDRIAHIQDAQNVVTAAHELGSFI